MKDATSAVISSIYTYVQIYRKTAEGRIALFRYAVIQCFILSRTTQARTVITCCQQLPCLSAYIQSINQPGVKQSKQLLFFETQRQLFSLEQRTAPKHNNRCQVQRTGHTGQQVFGEVLFSKTQHTNDFNPRAHDFVTLEIILECWVIIPHALGVQLKTDPTHAIQCIMYRISLHCILRSKRNTGYNLLHAFLRTANYTWLGD